MAATNLDKMISAIVRALSRERGLGTVDIQTALGVSRGTLHHRLDGEIPWTAREVVALSEFFDVSVLDLLVTS